MWGLSPYKALEVFVGVGLQWDLEGSIGPKPPQDLGAVFSKVLKDLVEFWPP